MAQAFRAVHNFDAATQILEQARREHPKSAAPLAMLGDLDLELQTYDAAIAHLTAALAIEPANLDARNRLAVAYKAKGGAADMAMALSRLRKCWRAIRKMRWRFTRAGNLRGSEPRWLGAGGRRKSGGIAAAECAWAGAAGEDFSARSGGGYGRGNKIALREGGSGAGAFGGPAGDGASSPEMEPADSETLFLLSRAYRCAGRTRRPRQPWRNSRSRRRTTGPQGKSDPGETSGATGG